MARALIREGLGRCATSTAESMISIPIGDLHRATRNSEERVVEQAVDRAQALERPVRRRIKCAIDFDDETPSTVEVTEIVFRSRLQNGKWKLVRAWHDHRSVHRPASDQKLATPENEKQRLGAADVGTGLNSRAKVHAHGDAGRRLSGERVLIDSITILFRVWRRTLDFSRQPCGPDDYPRRAVRPPEIPGTAT
jgi:hypothetical protein